MKKEHSLKDIPTLSIVKNNFEKIDYYDTYAFQKRTDKSIDQLIQDIFTTPDWVNYLMWIRNRIVKIFGLKTGNGIETKISTYYPIGSRAVYFTVVDRNDNEIVMQENDKHLNFRVSILHDKQNNLIYLTTLVRFHNLLGKTYFFLIQPFHRMIIKNLLKRQSKEL